MDKIRILIADDHMVVREGLVTILQSEGDFEIVGQAKDGEEAIHLARTLLPDVILLDIQIPKVAGIEATAQILQHNPTINIVLFSTFDEEDYIFRGIQAGAKGYVLKDSDSDELLNVIRAASRGESLLPSNIATKLTRHLSLPKTELSLTNRELDVLYLMARGSTNREIADELNITERTVKTHMASIITKFGVRNRTEVLSHALKRGLVKLD